MEEKRGQFFIIAAVILSIIVVALVSVGNKVIVGGDQDDFYDLSDELKHETSMVMDYSLHNENEEVDINMGDFSVEISEVLYDQDPELEFYILYLKDSVAIVDTTYARDGLVSDAIGGAEIIDGEITLDLGGSDFERPVFDTVARDYGGVYKETIYLTEGQSVITVTIGDSVYTFDVGDRPQVILILKREYEDERYIDIS